MPVMGLLRVALVSAVCMAAAGEGLSRIAGPEDLGPLPFRVNWPAPPVIQREVVVDRVEDYWLHARESGTRFRIRRSLPGPFSILASDVEVVLEDGVRLERMRVGEGLKRVRVVGGEVSGTGYGWGVQVGGYHQGGGTTPGVNEWSGTIVEDVLFDGVSVRAATTGFHLRGRRVAVINCDVAAAKNAVLCWDHSRDNPSEDVIVAGCRAQSAGLAGGEAVRLENVVRAVVVGNALSGAAQGGPVAFDSCTEQHAARNVTAGGLKLTPDGMGRLASAWTAHDYAEVLRLLAVAEGRDVPPAEQPSYQARHDAWLAEYEGFRTRKVPRITGPEDLGPLPFTLNWPAPPRIEREVTVNTMADFTAGAATPGTRLLVKANLPGRLTVQADDVEVVLDSGVSVGDIVVGRGHKRVRVAGGSARSVEVALPLRYDNAVRGQVFMPEYVVEDVVIDGVTVRAATIAFPIKGRRVALLNCDAYAGHYGVFCAPYGPHVNEDIVVAGCTLRSAGPESTVRLIDTVRGVVVDNVLYNPVKHNYRVHGASSDLHLAARNTMNGGGMMIATMPWSNDHIGQAWFMDNVMNHTTWDLFHVGGAGGDVERMVAHHNVFNSVRDIRSVSVRPPTVGDLKDNTVTPNAAIDARVREGIAALQAVSADVGAALRLPGKPEEALRLLEQAEDATAGGKE